MADHRHRLHRAGLLDGLLGEARIVAQTDVPKLAGTYVYGDYCTGEVRGLLARKGIGELIIAQRAATGG